MPNLAAVMLQQAGALHPAAAVLQSHKQCCLKRIFCSLTSNIVCNACSAASQTILFVTLCVGLAQVSELARMSEQEINEYRKQLNGIKVGAAAALPAPLLLTCAV